MVPVFKKTRTHFSLSIIIKITICWLNTHWVQDFQRGNGRVLIGSESSDIILKLTIIQTISDRYENGPIIAQADGASCRNRPAGIFGDKLSFPVNKGDKQ
jgi:hypothetical protein